MNSLEEIKSIYGARHNKALEWKEKGGKVLGYIEVVTPCEIIYAANILPIRILGGVNYPKLADRYTKNYSCPYQRSLLDQALQGKYDYLDGFVAPRACDTSVRFYSIFENHIKMKYSYFIDFPHKVSPGSLDYLCFSLKKFRKSLEDTFGQEITDNSLENAVVVYNKNRSLLKALYDLRISNPPLISGSEVLQVVISSMIMSKSAHNELLQRVVRDIHERKDVPQKGPRLLITGSLIYSTDLLDLIEKLGGNVVADDLSIGSRYFWDEVKLNGDVLESIARRYLEKIPSPWMHNSRERLAHIASMVQKYNVDGAIIHTTKFCTPHLADCPPVINEFKKLGVPYTHVEGDSTAMGVERMRTQLQAFIETLGIR